MDLRKLLESVEPPSAAMAQSIIDYSDGRALGLRGEFAPSGQSESFMQGWTAGAVMHRVNEGSALAVMMTGTHCKTCESINYGYRMGCRCNGDIEWGALMLVKDGEPTTFRRWDDLRAARDAGTPVIDGDTGLDFDFQPQEQK